MLLCKQWAYLGEKLKQCKTLKQIHQVHAQTITRGLLSLHPCSSLLLTKITTLGLLTQQHSLHSILIHYSTALFNLINNPSTFSYNTIIRAHTLLSSPQYALIFFTQMHRLSVPPDSHTFPFVLKACAHLRSLSLATTLHSLILKYGFLSDIFVCNTLIRIYSVNDHIHDARHMFEECSFRDVVSHNVLIDALVKAGQMGQARELFENMPVRDAVSWGTLLAGFAQMNQCREAIELFDRMVESTVRPDNIALVSVLSACAKLGELEKGKTVHHYIERNRIRVDVFLLTGLVDLYAKCGCIDTAREIFESSFEKNLFTWNAMLIGLAMHGQGVLLLDYLSRMVRAGVRPDGVTFLGVLVGCSHAGLIDEARQIFGEMERFYEVPRELKHYGCMADLLGRAGLIREAVEMIEAMPMSGDVFVWGGLLGGCRTHGNVEVAEKAAKHVLAINPQDGGVYSVLANVYANAERWDDLAKIRRLRDCKRVSKNAGCSLIESNGVTHEFVAGDDLHPQTADLYMVLNGIRRHQFESL